METYSMILRIRFPIKFIIINPPCLLPEVYVFTLVRKRGVTSILITPIQGDN